MDEVFITLVIFSAQTSKGPACTFLVANAISWEIIHGSESERFPGTLLYVCQTATYCADAIFSARQNYNQCFDEPRHSRVHVAAAATIYGADIRVTTD